MTDLIDCTAELQSTHPEYLLDNSIVILTASQLAILRRFLDGLSDIGDDLNFVIERCVDEDPGYNLCWDNDGRREQDDELTRRIYTLCRELGFI
ncbi:hypothetical protein [Rhizobium sp.]|uniref:hypothetical protein n=1 Tax=Rhizobium sp. TaxID=391 RepID=UPI0028A60B39